MGGLSLMDFLNREAARQTMTKEEFGRVMHDPNSTEEDINAALKCLEEADGYENLAD